MAYKEYCDTSFNDSQSSTSQNGNISKIKNVNLLKFGEKRALTRGNGSVSDAYLPVKSS